MLMKALKDAGSGQDIIDFTYLFLSIESLSSFALFQRSLWQGMRMTASVKGLQKP